MTTISPQTADAPSASLQKSYNYCRRLTKRQAANFYFGMKLMPEPKRSAMYALYAYMRLVDDIADDDANLRTLAQRRHDLDHWEQLTLQAINHTAHNPVPSPSHPVTLSPNHSSPLWPAFADMAHTYGLPEKIFTDMIAGQRQDLEPLEIKTFLDLYHYCHRVASVVGMASLYVWGFEGGQHTLELAAARGIAFQLTNVLRDLREDSTRDAGPRCYLPTEELARFQIEPADLASPKLAASKNFLDLMQFQLDRARDYYEQSSTLESKITADSRPTLIAMTAIYRGILEKIALNPAKVLTHRIRLSTPSKLLIGWRAMRNK